MLHTTAARMRQKEESLAWQTLFAVTFINSAHASLSVVGIPAYSIKAGVSPNALSLLLAAAPFAAGIAAFAMGSISDFVSRKKLLQFGLALLGGALLLHPFAENIALLGSLRALSGFASGMLFGLPATLLSDSFGGHKHQTLNSKTLCGYAIGQAIGIPAGIALLEIIGFPTLCSIIGIAAIACLAPTSKFLPTHPPFRPREAYRLTKHFHLLAHTLENPPFRRLAVVSLLSFTATSLFYVGFALWLFESAGLRPVEIAPMYFAGGALQVVALGFLNTRLLPLNPNYAIALSLFANAALFAFAFIAFRSVVGAAALFVLTLGTVSLRIPPVQFLANYLGCPRRKGARASVLQCGSQLGRALGGGIFAPLIFTTFSIQALVLTSSGLSLACAFLMLHDREKPPKPTQNPLISNVLSEESKIAPTGQKKRLWHARCSLKMSRKQLTPSAKANKGR